MSRSFGFLRKRPGRVDNTPFVRIYQVTKTLVNANAISFNISTNLTGGQTLNWDISGPSATEFTDSLGLANTVTLAANGNATVTKVISTTPYAANGNVYGNTNFTFNIRAGGANAGILTSNTAVITTPTNTVIPILATGGTETIIGNTKFHTFDNNGTFNILNIGYSPIAPIGVIYDLLVVGAGGGSGDRGPVTNGRGGHGGAGQVIVVDSITPMVANIPVTVGISQGNANGTSSSFGNTYIALGGGKGGHATGVGAAVIASNASIGGSGGGGGYTIAIGDTPTSTVGSYGAAGNGTYTNSGANAIANKYNNVSYFPPTGLSPARAGGGGGAGGAAPAADVSPFERGGPGIYWHDLTVEYAKGGGLTTTATPGSGGISPATPPSQSRGGYAGSNGIVKIRYNYAGVPNRSISLT